MIGVESKWECPSCGTIIETEQPLMKSIGGYKFKSPHGCYCGRKHNFTIISFKEIPIAFIPDGYELKKKTEEEKHE